MILNWTYGMEMHLDVAAKTFTGIEDSQLLEMPLTLLPVAVFLRTSAGGNAELRGYYRTDQDAEFTMRVSTGGESAGTQMYAALDNALLLSCSGGAPSQPASVECTILGVKQ
ncbi:hypothetical protein SDC9_198576 [bioreactor metagenome]|uniref:Uncharacterized protein n=1 Tax=bioreactor metagenome TaxID=1076179 RepID=A0A645IIW8_9ZZZZ|nr:hypothetical protein [Candidatus Pelethousia sp.]NCB30972.1 hypothetical protein [Clostridia bacterium]